MFVYVTYPKTYVQILISETYKIILFGEKIFANVIKMQVRFSRWTLSLIRKDLMRDI